VIAGVAIVATSLIVTGLYYVLFGTAGADEALDARGELVMATPVSYRLSSTSQGGAVKRYDITFTFTDERGNERTTTIESNHRSQVEAVESETPLEIEYDPENPSHARWPGTKLNPAGNIGYWLTGALAVLGLLLGAAGLRRAGVERRVYRDGEARAGRIDRVESYIENRRTVYRVEYSYAAEGTRVQATWKARNVVEPEQGPIWVIVDPDDAFVSVPVLQT
jgi:hypothetical protein